MNLAQTVDERLLRHSRRAAAMNRIGTPRDTIVLRNRQVLLVQRPDGLPKPTDFRLQTTNLEAPAEHFCPSKNASVSEKRSETITSTTLLLETLYVSIDPAMRGWMSNAKSYLPPVKLGTVMRASTVCRVIASSTTAMQANDGFPIGCVVRTEIVGVQSYYKLENTTLVKTRKLLTRLDNAGIVSPFQTSSLSYASYLGVLGTTGITAYFGLLKVGKPLPSDSVLISGAAGATGSIVAQIAKRVVGCRKVIGTAGSKRKCEWLLQNKIVDVAINYKTCRSLSGAIAKAVGKSGVDLVFDNVGSGFLEAALSNLATGGKIVLCGAISQYNTSQRSAKHIFGPRNYMNLLTRRGTMKGFVVFDYRKDYATAIKYLAEWIREKKITCYQEDLRHKGIDRFYPALLSLFEGTNVGKVVLTIVKTDHRGSAMAKL